jgi:ligand-binding SRPBCC domain-containing protein
MFRVKDTLHVDAPADRVFLLATSIPLVQQILDMKPVAGQTTGFITASSTVTWSGWKFGLPTRHVTQISAYDRPFYFRDTMAQGRFKEFHHDHHFEEVDGQTVMRDIVHFSLPLGPLGKLVGRYIVAPYVLRLVQARFAMLKRIAEGTDWERYLAGAPAAIPAALSFAH